LVGARKVKAGTQVTIGVGGDVVGGLATRKYVGGLLLCDSDRFKEVKAQMEQAPPVPLVSLAVVDAVITQFSGPTGGWTQSPTFIKTEIERLAKEGL